MRTLVVFSLLFGVVLTAATAQTSPHKTQNIIFVMTDGLRWQEVFGGADEALLNKENGGIAEPKDLKALKAAYWRDTPQERRAALMPFLWSVMAKDGQIFGNPARSSEAFVTNGLNFSYPGYNETLCGFADPRVNSNDKVLNPNVTVLEWLNQKPAFHGKVAAFGAWDVFPYIFNADRAGFPVNAGYDPLTSIEVSPRLELLNQLKEQPPHYWDDEPFDSIPFFTAIEYLKARNPRILYLSLGETDDWAHAGDYAKYLGAAHQADADLRILWDMIQAMPEYHDKTTLIFSPDHGRGRAPQEWKDHGKKIPESKFIWMAFLGPDTPALGERSNIAAVKQNQIAATLAALLGEDYRADVPKAGAPLTDVLSGRP